MGKAKAKSKESEVVLEHDNMMVCIAEAIRRGCEMPSLVRVCAWTGGTVWCVRDVAYGANMAKRSYKYLCPMYVLAGELPKDQRQSVAIDIIVSNFNKSKLWADLKYKGV